MQLTVTGSSQFLLNNPGVHQSVLRLLLQIQKRELLIPHGGQLIVETLKVGFDALDIVAAVFREIVHVAEALEQTILWRTFCQWAHVSARDRLWLTLNLRVFQEGFRANTLGAS